MQAIEFVTKVKDGFIKIPKEYLKSLGSEFRVIILLDQEALEKKVSSKKKQRRLTSINVKTKGLVFDRDEANER